MPPGKYHIISTGELEPELIRLAQEHGISLTVKPFIRTRQLTSPRLAETLQQLADMPAAIVFTSSQAVRAVAGLLKGKPAGSWKIFCLEGNTLDEVRLRFSECGILGTGPDSRKLAACILETGSADPLVFCCGNLRRKDLPDMLGRASVPLKEIVVYETIALPAKLDTDFDGILFFSPSGADSFFPVNRIPPGKICFVIGESTAKKVASLCSNRVIICQKPGREALIIDMIRYFDPDIQVHDQTEK